MVDEPYPMRWLHVEVAITTSSGAFSPVMDRMDRAFNSPIENPDVFHPYLLSRFPSCAYTHMREEKHY